jgi:REP element-mobilizing transposase RayT
MASDIANKYNPAIHHRRSIRIKQYDYSQVGAYFVTICTYNREGLFGDIVDGEIRLNEWGHVVEDCWEWLDKQYAYVDLDTWIIMLNHLHGIIVITDDKYSRGVGEPPIRQNWQAEHANQI